MDVLVNSVGKPVHVKSRTWPGINKPGGVGHITAFNPENYTFDIKYVFGGKEKGVEMAFLNDFQLDTDEDRGRGRGGVRRSSRRRRGSSANNPNEQNMDNSVTGPCRREQRKEKKRGLKHATSTAKQHTKKDAKKPNPNQAKSTGMKRKATEEIEVDKSDELKSRIQTNTSHKLNCKKSSVTANDEKKLSSFKSVKQSNKLARATQMVEGNKQYAFADYKTKNIFMYITSQTTNTHLAKIYNEQKRRDKKDSNLSSLYLYEITTNTNENGAITKNLRKMGPEDPTPVHAESSTYRAMKEKKINNRQKDALEGKGNQFQTPSKDTIIHTYNALKRLLGEDCESLKSVLIANSYYEYWRPSKPKVILLAESHVSTPESFSCEGPIFDKSHIRGSNIEYNGPLDFCSLVYCLSYGENDTLRAVDDRRVKEIPRAENLGTWQFWNLFSACISPPPNGDPKQYGKDLLKSSTLTTSERIQRKLQILNELKQRGIWLLDASIIGWYIPQDTPYDIAKKSKKVTKLTNLRPNKNLKKPCLVISWEGHVKHLVQKAANEGELKLFIPIGKDVESAIGKDRFREALSGSEAKLVNAFPAPNAHLKGGYSSELEKLSQWLNGI